jgi:hypothetical protein
MGDEPAAAGQQRSGELRSIDDCGNGTLARAGAFAFWLTTPVPAPAAGPVLSHSCDYPGKRLARTMLLWASIDPSPPQALMPIADGETHARATYRMPKVQSQDGAWLHAGLDPRRRPRDEMGCGRSDQELARGYNNQGKDARSHRYLPLPNVRISGIVCCNLGPTQTGPRHGRNPTVSATSSLAAAGVDGLLDGMPITFRLRRDHLGAPYSSETNFVAISGEMEIGGVSRYGLHLMKGKQAPRAVVSRLEFLRSGQIDGDRAHWPGWKRSVPP